jgi:phosphate-selective porin OprO and OprP
MRKKLSLVLVGLLTCGACLVPGRASAEEAAPPAASQDRLDILEGKIRALEEARDNAAAKAKESPAPAAGGKDGFALKSADGGFKLKFSGLLQFDARFYADDKTGALADQFLVRRARPIFEGTINKYADFKITPDFGGGTMTLQDTYLEFTYVPKAKLRFGKFKVPVGLERLQPTAQIVFVENALPTALTANYDTGIMLNGDILKETVNYAVAMVNGTADGASGDGDAADSKDYVARVFVSPFKNGSIGALKELGLGAAGSTGIQKGTASSPGLATYKTSGQQTFFSYRSDVVANGVRKRVSPQLYWYPSNVGFMAEYVYSSQEVKRATTTTTTTPLANTAWQVAANWVVTGELPTYKGFRPRRIFNPAEGNWGALELAARYGQLAVDKDAFTRYADPARSAQKARNWSGAVNWYLNANLKWMSDFEYTRFSKGDASGDRPIERAILSRVQLSF